jgi:ligand-binding sensor domain-containing protein/signal transduction histidine kinase
MMRRQRVIAFILSIYCLAISLSLSQLHKAQALTDTQSAEKQPLTNFERYLFNVWDTDEGLPQVSVNSIVQTRDGYLWLATYGGLVRFDGVRFTVFDVENTPGLKSNRITDLHEDRDGNLWIGTERGGVSRLQNGKVTTYTMRDGLPSDHIGAIFQDSRGSIWMCSGEGLIRFKDGEFSVFTKRDGLPENLINSITEDSAGNLWVGVRNGLIRFDTENRFTVYTTADGLPQEHIRVVLPARDKGLWIGTFNGLFKYNGEKFIPYSLPKELSGKKIRCLEEDTEGNLWIGTLENGLSRMDSNGQFIHFSTNNGLPDSEVRAVFEDAEGNIWVGTNTGGLTRMKRGMAVAFTKANGLPSDIVVPITEDASGNLWIGSCGGLVRFFSGKMTVYNKKDGLPSDCVWSLHASRAGVLWIGTWDGGLTRFSNGEFTTFTSSNSGLSNNVVLSLYEDSKGVLWIGTSSGLNRYENGAFTVYSTADGLVYDDVRYITEGRDGSLWVGTTGGFSRLFNGKFTSYTTDNGLSHNFVRAIHEDADGTIWIGTYGGGLNRLRDNRFTHFNTHNGLFDNVVSRILEDANGDFWMSGNRGIFRSSRAELNEFAEGRRGAVRSVSYGVADGMANHETNGGGQPAGWQSRDGRLWFPTVKGAVVFDPERITVNKRPPPVTVEKMLFDQTAFDQLNNLRFPAGKGDLEIHYTALSFVAPEKIQFKYKLEGYDDDWIEPGTRRVAYYTNVPPGNYRFRVAAANNDGVWNDEGAVLAFSIAPAFYQTTWFLLLCGAGVAGLFLMGYRWRVHQVRERMAMQFEERLSERTRIAQELHDSLMQGFVSVSMQLSVAVDNLPKESSSKNHLTRVLELMNQVRDEGRNTLRGLRSANADNTGSLEQALSDIKQDFTAREPAEIRLIIEGLPRPLLPLVRDEAYQIGREALLNAYRHSKAKNIEIIVEYCTKNLKLRIRDDGKGIDPQVLQNGRDGHWGLIGMRERAKKIESELKVWSRVGAGTEVELTVPHRHAYPKSSSQNVLRRFSKTFFGQTKAHSEENNKE